MLSKTQAPHPTHATQHHHSIQNQKQHRNVLAHLVWTARQVVHGLRIQSRLVHPPPPLLLRFLPLPYRNRLTLPWSLVCQIRWTPKYAIWMTTRWTCAKYLLLFLNDHLFSAKKARQKNISSHFNWLKFYCSQQHSVNHPIMFSVITTCYSQNVTTCWKVPLKMKTAPSILY